MLAADESDLSSVVIKFTYIPIPGNHGPSHSTSIVNVVLRISTFAIVSILLVLTIIIFFSINVTVIILIVFVILMGVPLVV